MELTIVIPAKNEAQNIARAVRETTETCRSLGAEFEILVIDGGSGDGTPQAVLEAGAVVHTQESPGYGGALREGFRRARGEYVITMDADLSHSPDFIATLWRERTEADLVIASRYAQGGRAEMPFFRALLSRLLNAFFRIGLAVPLRDLSSGFRLYRAEMLRGIDVKGTNFDALLEILVAVLSGGYRVKEVPFAYRPRAAGSSNARVIAFGWSYLKTFFSLLRNS